MTAVDCYSLSLFSKKHRVRKCAKKSTKKINGHPIEGWPFVSETLRAPGLALKHFRLSAADMPVYSGQICQSKGLVSIDRSEAAALLSTTPRLRTRSSTNDFAPLRCMGWVSLRPGLPAPGWLRAVLLWLCHRGRRKRSIPVYRCLPTLRR